MASAPKPRTKKKVETVPTPAEFKAYILRTCDSRLRSYNDFRWPESGHVAAPDWRATKECGHGLHGFLWGEGDGSLASFDLDAKWIVAGINEWIDLSGKVKFPEAWVVHCGDRLSATAFIQSLGAKGAIDGGTATAGDGGTVIARFYDYKAERYRVAIGYVGEDGIKPNTKYRVDDAGKLVEAQ